MSRWNYNRFPFRFLRPPHTRDRRFAIFAYTAKKVIFKN
jgi:hypothetical protein